MKQDEIYLPTTMDNDTFRDDTPPEGGKVHDEQPVGGRRAYSAPVLSRYGSVRHLTAGGTKGTNEEKIPSTSGGYFKVRA